MKKQLIFSFAISFLLLFIFKVNAQDRIFNYTYQSGVLNKGQREIEIWNTLRTGKTDYFSRLDHRTEFEIGLGHNLQTAFYLNLSSKTSTAVESGLKSLETETELSFSNEWKYKLLDASADPIGLALYGEVGFGSLEREYEAKLIVDKKIGKFTLASNLVYELENEVEISSNETDWESEHKAEFNVGLAYAITPKLQITTEHLYRNVFVEGNLEHSAIYSGIGLSYVMNNFWVNLSVLPQIKGLKGSNGNSLNLSEYEKMQCRMLVSFAF